MDYEQYKAIYDEVYDRNPNYGAGHGLYLVPRIVEVLRKIPNPTLVDCGCGRHILASRVHSAFPGGAQLFGVDVHQHDPVPAYVTFKAGPLWDLSFLPGKVSVITCFDTLEHLHPDDVADTIDSWADALDPQGRVFTTICTRPAALPAPKGVDNLHMTVRPLSWWEAQFARRFNSVVVEGNEVLIAGAPK